MADSMLRDLSTDFAVQAIKICDGIKGHYSLVNQLERSSTSIGANIHEANYAHSKADFIAKFQIALSVKTRCAFFQLNPPVGRREADFIRLCPNVQLPQFRKRGCGFLYTVV